MSTHEVLEQQEHAEHAAGHGNKRAALLIAVLAAGLAICEQQGKHAEIAVQENAILTADAWAQYQAKSIRCRHCAGHRAAWRHARSAGAAGHDCHAGRPAQGPGVRSGAL